MAAEKGLAQRSQLLLWCGILLLLFFSWESARLALANAIASQVYVDIRQMQSNTSANDWKALDKTMGSALLLNQHNPDYQDVQLMLRQRAGEVGRVSDDDLRLYRQLVQQRPTWPYVWLNLLTAKSSRAEFDTEYEQIWRQILRLAPWVKKINSTLLHRGFDDWDELEPEAQQLVLEAVEKGLVLHPKTVDKLAKKFSRTAALCAQLEANQRTLLSCSDEMFFSSNLEIRNVSNG